MKNVRFILVFLVFAGMISCSSDDDGNTEGAQKDAIIGKWKMQSYTVDGEVLPITECEAKSVLEFFANGNVTSTEFYEDFETEECISEITTQKWQNRGNNVYRITEGNQSIDLNIVFTGDKNSFTISGEDGDESYSMVYTRA